MFFIFKNVDMNIILIEYIEAIDHQLRRMDNIPKIDISTEIIEYGTSKAHGGIVLLLELAPGPKSRNTVKPTVTAVKLPDSDEIQSYPDFDAFKKTMVENTCAWGLYYVNRRIKPLYPGASSKYKPEMVLYSWTKDNVSSYKDTSLKMAHAQYTPDIVRSFRGPPIVQCAEEEDFKILPREWMFKD